MNIAEFYAELANRASLRAQIENDYTSAAMMGELSDALVECEEVDNLTTLHFEGTGYRKRKLRVDGYDLEDPDGSVALAVLISSSEPQVSGLPQSEANKCLANLQFFLEECVSGSFLKDREESSAVYQLADDLRRRGRNVTRYRLYLLTNRPLVGRGSSIDSTEVNGVRVDFHIWDLNRFHQVYESKQGRETLDIELSEWLPQGLNSLCLADQDSGFETYLSAVPAAVLADLYSRYGSRLLESNVRSYLSARGKVNKGIRDTVLSDPEMFLAYNNGITATATGVKGIEDHGGNFRITNIRDLQIVNGGQTTASLFYVRRDAKILDGFDRVFVQMKLVVVDAEVAENVVPWISRYANSQNKVSEVDFFSNSAFHVRIENLSRRVLTPTVAGVNFQTKWFYERTRGQYQSERSALSPSDLRKFDAQYPKRQVLTKTDIAKYEVTFAMKPHLVSAGAQKNFVAFANEIGAKWLASENDFNELFFKELVAKAIVYEMLRSAIARADWYDKGYLANIVTYAIAKLVYEIARQHRGSHLNLEEFWAHQRCPDSVIDEGLRLGKIVLEVLTDPRRPVQNVTEWAKREDCWAAVKGTSYALSDDLAGALTSIERRRSSIKNAASTQKVDSGIDLQIRIMKISKEEWLRLKKFGEERGLLSPRERGVLDVVGKGRIPSEKQCVVLASLLERTSKAGYVSQ